MGRRVCGCGQPKGALRKKGSLALRRQRTGQCALITFHSLNSDHFFAIKYIPENTHVLCSFSTLNWSEGGAALVREVAPTAKRPHSAPWVWKSKEGVMPKESNVEDPLLFLLTTRTDATWLPEIVLFPVYTSRAASPTPVGQSYTRGPRTLFTAESHNTQLSSAPQRKADVHQQSPEVNSQIEPFSR